MAVRNQAWHNLNESRAYPFDDSATLLDNSGEHPPLNIISGLHMLIPEAAGKHVFVSAISVTEHLVTVTLSATETLDADAVVTPVAVVSQEKPVERYQQYALEAQYPGVGGWIVFGGGVVKNYTGMFSTVTQSLLAAKAARYYRMPAVASIGTASSNVELTGLVTLTGGNDIEIVKECREVPDTPVNTFDPFYCGSDSLGTKVREVIVFRLRDTSATQDRNVFDIYAGPCKARPESQNCLNPDPIESLGSVLPDCCGNIILEFTGCSAITEVSEAVTLDDDDQIIETLNVCGVIVDCELGLIDACTTPDRLPDSFGKLPTEYGDFCSVSVFSVSLPSDPVYTCSFDSIEAAATEQPTAENLDGLSTCTVWELRLGSFTCDAGVDISTTGFAGQNLIAYVPAAAIVSTYYKKITTRFSLASGTPVGALHNAGVVANYQSSTGSFVVAEVDWDGQATGYKGFRIARFSGEKWTTLSMVDVPGLQLNDEYEITLVAVPSADDPTGGCFKATLLGITDPSIDLTLDWVHFSGYEPEDGEFGLATKRSSATFTKFTVENYLVDA